MLTRARPEGCLSDLALDRMVSGERPVDLHVKRCAACAARLADLRQERGVPKRRSWLPVAVVGVVAAAAALVLFLRVQPQPGVAAKGGGSELSLFVKRGDQVSEWQRGQALHPGDALRFTLSGHGERWVAVLARDGAGQASVYFPPGTSAQKVWLDGATALPGSVTLDAITGAEDVYALSCQHEQALAPLQAQLEGGRLAAPEGCELTSLRYEKVP